VYVKPSAPHSIGGVLDDAIKLYREAFAKSWPIAFCGRLLIAVPGVILGLRFRSLSVAGNPQAVLAEFKSPVVWLSYLVLILVALGFYNALLVQVDGWANSRPGPARQSVATGFRLVPRTILLAVIMFAVLFAGGLVVGILVAFLAKSASSPVVTSLITSVILIPFVLIAIYAWGRVFLSNVALVVEDAKATDALKISWSLIKNHWWRTATIYTVAIVIVAVFYVVIGILNAILVAMLGAFSFATLVLSQLVTIAGGTVFMSFVPAVLLSMYYDLKLRKEGTDLAGRVNALAPG